MAGVLERREGKVEMLQMRRHLMKGLSSRVTPGLKAAIFRPACTLDEGFCWLRTKSDSWHLIFGVCYRSFVYL